MNKKIAITGGIGSGKSLALEIVKGLGYATLSSDRIVSELYKTHRVKKLIKENFPNAVSGNKRYRLHREILASEIFASQEKHALLTGLITPLVIKEIDRRTAKTTNLTFVEVPLLFECNYQNLFDGVWVLVRPLDERIQSVKARSNLTERQILERIAKQVDYSTIDLSPYTVIRNASNKEKLKQTIIKLIKEL